jgi:hypothetical protein
VNSCQQKLDHPNSPDRTNDQEHLEKIYNPEIHEKNDIAEENSAKLVGTRKEDGGISIDTTALPHCERNLRFLSANLIPHNYLHDSKSPMYPEGS